MKNKTLREHKFRVLVMCDINGTISELSKEHDDKLIEKYIEDQVDSYCDYMIEDFDIEEDEFEDVEDKINESDTELIKNFLRQLLLNLEKIDNIIKENLKNWDMKRLPKEDLNVLRLCIYEMYFDDKVDEKVAINEAINIAKSYGNEKVGKFINGILRSVYESQK